MRGDLMDENNFDRIGLTEKQISEQFRTIDQIGRSGALDGVAHSGNAMASLHQHPDISGAIRTIVEAQQQLENVLRPIDLTFWDNLAVAQAAWVQTFDDFARIVETLSATASYITPIVQNLSQFYNRISLDTVTRTLEMLGSTQYQETLVNQLFDVLDRFSGDFVSNALDYLAEEEFDFAFTEDEFSVSEDGGFILEDEEFSMNEVMDYLEKMMCKQDELLENDRTSEIDDKTSKRESRLQFLVSLLLTILFYLIPVDRLQEFFDPEVIATKCFVTEHKSRLYAEANSSTSEIAILPEETELAIIEDDQRWYYVEYSDQDGNTLRGWIPKDNVEAE